MRNCSRLLALGAGLLIATAVAAAPRALLIGVANVPHNELPGVDLDMDNMKKVAEIMGYKPSEIKVLFNDQATYANVHEALNTWVRDGVGPNDHVLIYFSGHGTRVPDPDPDNANGSDDALVLRDVARATVKGKASLKGVLIGHELGAALAAIPSHDVLVLVDACHSGSATRELTLGNLSLGVHTGVKKFFSYPGMPAAPAGSATRGLKVPSGAENYAALSAARDDESAIGTEQGGLFTLGVVGAIEDASRDSKHPTVIDLRTAATTFIAAHTDKDTIHHPVADGNERLIKGELALIPLKDGQGPTWQSLATLAAQQPQQLTVSGGAKQIRVGDKVVLAVNVPRDGYLNVVTVDSQDRATVLYPNKFNTSNEVKAGEFRFPTPDMNFVVRASDPTGPSLVVAFLSDKKVNLLDMGIEGRDAAGKMQQVFTEVNARGTRALVIESKQSQMAAGTLTVRVEPAAH
jgi:metacaspase-1